MLEPMAVPRAAPRPGTPAGGAVDPEALRRAFRRHAAGVAIVTMTGANGPVGFTATSVASLSERPPLVSLSLSTRSSVAPTLLRAETLVVHLMSEGQQVLAARFAEPGADRFAAPTRWRQLGSGEPLLLDAAVWLRCRIRNRIAAGDHHLVVAEAVGSRTDRLAAPLVYHDGAYGTVCARGETGRADIGRAGSGRAGTGQAGSRRADGDLGIRRGA